MYHIPIFPLLFYPLPAQSVDWAGLPLSLAIKSGIGLYRFGAHIAQGRPIGCVVVIVYHIGAIFCHHSGMFFRLHIQTRHKSQRTDTEKQPNGNTYNHNT